MRRHILITGGSRGIGAALAKKFYKNNDCVSIFSKNKNNNNKYKKFLNCYYADISNKKDIQRQILKSINQHGFPDVVILNAGIYKPVNAENIDSNIFKEHIDINYLGIIYCLEIIVPLMVKSRKGQIAIMSSVAGYRGLPKSSAYGPTKAALQNLVECLYFDLNKYGIKLQIINPGFVKTDATSINDFKMPQLISAEKAAFFIFNGLHSSKFEIAFPPSFSKIMKLLKLLPHLSYLKLVGRKTGYHK